MNVLLKHRNVQCLGAGDMNRSSSKPQPSQALANFLLKCTHTAAFLSFGANW